jgi:hypothetical protein
MRILQNYGHCAPGINRFTHFHVSSVHLEEPPTILLRKPAIFVHLESILLERDLHFVYHALLVNFLRLEFRLAYHALLEHSVTLIIPRSAIIAPLEDRLLIHNHLVLSVNLENLVIFQLPLVSFVLLEELVNQIAHLV